MLHCSKALKKTKQFEMRKIQRNIKVYHISMKLELGCFARGWHQGGWRRTSAQGSFGHQPTRTFSAPLVHLTCSQPRMRARHLQRKLPRSPLHKSVHAPPHMFATWVYRPYIHHCYLYTVICHRPSAGRAPVSPSCRAPNRLQQGPRITLMQGP